jgi:hypothetical protein
LIGSAGAAGRKLLGFKRHLRVEVVLPGSALARAGDRSISAGLLGCSNNSTVHNQPYLVPDPAQPLRTPESYHYQPCADLAADVRTVQTRLEAAGLEVLVLDQTRPDVGLPVVKVIVPVCAGCGCGIQASSEP